eukprot:7490359-Pyramimonas_sp.AAC.1
MMMTFPDRWLTMRTQTLWQRFAIFPHRLRQRRLSLRQEGLHQLSDGARGCITAARLRFDLIQGPSDADVHLLGCGSMDALADAHARRAHRVTR